VRLLDKEPTQTERYAHAARLLEMIDRLNRTTMANISKP